MAGPSPTPQPNPSPTASGDEFAQLQAAVNGSSSSSTPDLYGLGQWRTQPIDPSGFPPSIVLLLQQAGIDTSQAMTAGQLAQAIAQAKSPLLVSQVQQMLYYAGAYGPSVKSFTDLQNGTFGQQDIKALAQEITNAGQTGAAFGTYLTTAANYGKANGILTTLTQSSSPTALPNTIDENAVLRAEAHTLFGHDPDPDEYARFQAFYNTKVQQAATAQAQAQNPPLPDGLPDAGTLGQALGNLPGSQFYTGSVLDESDFTTDPRRGETYNPLTPAARTQAQVARDQANTVAGQVTDFANNRQNGGADTFPAKPDLQSAAEAFLRQDDPGQVAAQQAATKYRTLLSILGGGS